MRLFLLTTLTMVAFAANSLLNRAALLDGQMDATLFGLIRLVAGAVVLAALIWSRASMGPLRDFRPWAIIALFTYIFGFSYAYQQLDAGLGALILFGTVQITMFAGALWEGEAVPPARWAGALVALGGLVWLFWPAAGIGVSPWPGLVMALAGVGWGVYSLLGRGARNPLADTARAFVGAALLAVAISLPELISGPKITGHGFALAVMSGAVTSGLGYALWYHILPRLGGSRAAVAQLTVPVIAILAGAALLGETITLGIAAATALVLGGIALGLSAR